MENLSRCHREKSGKRLLPHSTYILQHKNDIVKNNKYAETVVFCFIKPKKRKINNSVCRKSMFFKKSACPQSLSPLGHSVGFASCKAWCVLISASLPKTPFPVVKGCVCFVGSASCRAFVHTRPASVPGWMWGCRPHPAWGYAPNPIFISYVGLSTDCNRRPEKRRLFV